MLYQIKSIETELWTYWYTVEAESGDEALEKFRDGDWLHVEEKDSNYQETVDREIVDIEPYVEAQNEEGYE